MITARKATGAAPSPAHEVPALSPEVTTRVCALLTRFMGPISPHLVREESQGVTSLPIARPGRFLAISTSHSVAVHDGCTNIPLAAGGAQEDETILEGGFLSHAKLRFVHPDPPGLIRSWKI